MSHRKRQHGSQDSRRGIVLLAVLVTIVLLSLAAYSFSELMLSEAKAARSAQRVAQSQAIANSGIHYCAALLSNRDAFATTLNNNPFDNAPAFQNILVQPSGQLLYQGRFSVVTPLAADDAAFTSTP